MGRRRRKRIIKSVRKRIPTIFNCPNCGSKTVIVKMNKDTGTATVTCGYCNLLWNTPIKSFEEKVDVYSRFVDTLMEGGIER
jgi:transcription elongation factor Elf1